RARGRRGRARGAARARARDGHRRGRGRVCGGGGRPGRGASPAGYEPGGDDGRRARGAGGCGRAARAPPAGGRGGGAAQTRARPIASYGGSIAGYYFEEFEIGRVFTHAIRRTVTETDNVLFSTLTHNPAPLHIDHEYMRTQSEFGRPLMNSFFTLGLI